MFPRLSPIFTIFSRSFQITSAGNKVGFIGLGNMGSQMAINLARGGFNVHIFDKSSQRSEEMMKSVNDKIAGRFIQQKSLVELMHSNPPSTIITMLPSSPQVLEVYGDSSRLDGLISMAPEGTLFIDCTTGDPKVAQQMSEYAASHGCKFVDAPVSGGVPAAQQATLTFMVGGHDESVVRATSYLKSMGKRIFHCGPVGTGLAAKICNNMLLAISMIGTSEAMALGRRLGLDPAVLTEVINNSSGRCWSSEMYNPVPGIVPNIPSSNGYTGGFAMSLMTKDLALAQNASTSVHCSTPLGSLAHELYRNLCQQGYSQKDFSAVYQFLSESQ